MGGPNGYFSHVLRDGIRAREPQKAERRRPRLQGIAAVDRRAVHQALRWGSYRNRDVTAHQCDMMKAVVTGSPVFQKHLFAAGLAESATGLHCDSGEDEDEIHAYWRCPAWAHIRQRFFQQPSVTVDHLPAITQHCGLLTAPKEDWEATKTVQQSAPFAAGPDFVPDTSDDTFS